MVLGIGSSWGADVKIVIPAIEKINLKPNSKKIRVIFVPHEPTDEHISNLQNQIPNSILFSKIEGVSDENKRLDIIVSKDLIIDSIGKLLRLYANADIAYVGGAFGAGLHSVTEPAGYGIPVICGSSYHNSPDAKKLVKSNTLKSISNEEELYSYLEKLIDDEAFYNKIASQSREYIFSSKGSSEIAVKMLKEYL